jgi:hypothetical protein
MVMDWNGMGGNGGGEGREEMRGLTFLARFSWNCSIDLVICSGVGRLNFLDSIPTAHRAWISEMGGSGPLVWIVSKEYRKVLGE